MYHCDTTMLTSTAPLLSIVLPCYNPATDWIEQIERALLSLKKFYGSIELIVVNDGTPQLNLNTLKNRIEKVCPVKCVAYETNQGKGYALRAGVQNASGKYIVYTDIDFPYTQQSFLSIIEQLQKGADVVLGTRGNEYYEGLPAMRVRMSKILRWCIRTFLRLPTDDTQCGLKGFNEKGKQVFLSTTINRYLFDLEFVFLAARNSVNIQMTEAILRPEVQLRKMNWKILLQEFGNFLKIFVRNILKL